MPFRLVLLAAVAGTVLVLCVATAPAQQSGGNLEIYTAPTITGSPYVGSTLTAGGGAWRSPDPTSTTTWWEWSRCPSADSFNGCSSRSVNTAYTVTNDDRDHYLVVFRYVRWQGQTRWRPSARIGPASDAPPPVATATPGPATPTATPTATPRPTTPYTPPEVAPAAPPPRAVVQPVTPYFVTRAALRGSTLGRLDGVQRFARLRARSTVTLRCVRGCARALRVVARAGARPAQTAMKIRGGFTLRATTRIEIRIERANQLPRVTRYRFVRRDRSVLARTL